MDDQRMTPPVESIDQAQLEIIEVFSCFDDWPERYQYLIDLGRSLAPLAPEERIEHARLRGCQSRSWLVARQDQEGRLHFRAASESVIVSGLLALVLRVYSGRMPEEILRSEPRFLTESGLQEHLSPHRQTGVAHVLARLREAAQRAASVSAA